MTETLIVSSEPGCLRYIWLCVVGETFALWGFLVSIFLPMLQQQPDPPLEVETFASRYRLMTPDAPKESHGHGESHLHPPLFPGYASRRMHRSRSNDSLGPGQSTASLTCYEFSSLTARRSCSTSACYNVRVVTRRKDSYTGRPRTNSDPTDSRPTLNARRCMSIATSASSKVTTPVRPFIKRARTVLQRKMTIGDRDDDDDEEEEEEEEEEESAPGQGMGTRTKEAIQVARTRTMNAMNRTATAATAATAALFTASNKLTPTVKGNAGNTFADTSDREYVAGSEQERREEAVVILSEQTEVQQAPRHRRPKIFSRKLTIFTTSRLFSRRRT